MKILVLSHQFYPDIGGIEVNSEVLSMAFHDFGHQVRLLTWTKEQGSRTFPFEVIRNPGRFQLLKEHLWADVVFENNLCLRLAWPRVFIKRPSVIALNTWVSRVNGAIGWQDRLKNKWMKHSSAVIAVSDAVRSKCWKQAIVIGNPYRSELFKIQNGAKERCSDFVFMGRLVSDKGADLAIKAFQKFIMLRQANVRSLHDTYLTIVGEGPEAEKLKKLAKDTGLEDFVHFPGVLRGKDLVDCLNRHRFLLVPSIWQEPFGNVALEGMACGLIPIVSSGGGLPDAVGDAGLIFESGNVDSLAALMNRIYENTTEQSRIYKEAKNHLANHEPQIVAAKYLNVFQTAIA
jgi:glycosyltransferase involved in cell wall biosynthesis